MKTLYGKYFLKKIQRRNGNIREYESNSNSKGENKNKEEVKNIFSLYRDS